MTLGRKTGGRVAGTPNKASHSVRMAIAKALDDYFCNGTFTGDLAALDPKDRVTAMERFASYVSPKLQATTLDVATESKKTIEDRLICLSEENQD